jgi:hypothetical protein
VADTPTQGRDSGFFTRLSRTLRNKLLQRSSEAYLSCLTGGESYWDEVVQFQNSLQTRNAAIPHDYYQQPSPSLPAERSGEEH